MNTLTNLLDGRTPRDMGEPQWGLPKQISELFKNLHPKICLLILEREEGGGRRGKRKREREEERDRERH